MIIKRGGHYVENSKLRCKQSKSIPKPIIKNRETKKEYGQYDGPN